MKTAISIVIAAALIGVAILFSSSSPTVGTRENVRILGEKQVVDILAKGSYQPKKTIATAGVPTVLRLNTNGTFDCTSSVRIPSMGINQILAPSGTTEIDLGIPKVGKLKGVCAMGMYSFEIDFQGEKEG